MKLNDYTIYFKNTNWLYDAIIIQSRGFDASNNRGTICCILLAQYDNTDEVINFII